MQIRLDEVYWAQLNELIKKEGLLKAQVYNADETGLYWCSMPTNTLTRKDEKNIKREENN